MKRKIAVVYDVAGGLWTSILAFARAIPASRSRSAHYCDGPALSHEFGNTIEEIERDGFEIEARIECLLSSDSDVGMAKTIGVATLGLADALGADAARLAAAHRRSIRDVGARVGRVWPCAFRSHTSRAAKSVKARLMTLCEMR